jgi:hypothetical protein
MAFSLHLKHAHAFNSLEHFHQWQLTHYLAEQPELLLSLTVTPINAQQVANLTALFNAAPFENSVTGFEITTAASGDHYVLRANIGFGLVYPIGAFQTSLAQLTALQAQASQLVALYSADLHRLVVFKEHAPQQSTYRNHQFQLLDHDIGEIFAPSEHVAQLPVAENPTAEKGFAMTSQYHAALATCQSFAEKVQFLTQQATFWIESRFAQPQLTGSLSIFEQLKSALFDAPNQAFPGAKVTFSPTLDQATFQIQDPAIFQATHFILQHDARHQIDVVSLLNQQHIRTTIGYSRRSVLPYLSRDAWTCYYLPNWTFTATATSLFQQVAFHDRLFFFQSEIDEEDDLPF